MDQNDLGLARYDAGRDYLAALQRLGLEPDALFWAFDGEINQFVLVLVSPFFDYAGPLALSELLFKAYRASATPAEVDPFLLRLHSPRQKIYRDLLIYLRSTGTIEAGFDADEYHRAVIAGERTQAGVLNFKYADLESFGAWIYTASAKRRKLVDVARPWDRLSHRIEALAA
jgi:hypothetical protein